MPRPWEIPLARGSASRPRRRYLIVAEDSKSGLDYLRAFPISPVVQIESEGGAGNTISVVERALELREEALRFRKPYARVWCVIDRDDHPMERYQRAFEAAKPFSDVTVIWANECFELWYLLHFCYRDTGIGRLDLRRELARPNRLNRRYDKADKEVFARLQGRVEVAVRNARRLLQSNPSPDTNPSTNVHELVEQLLKLKDAISER